MTGFFNRVFKKGSGIPPGASFVITEQGKEHLSDYGADSESVILLTLETRGSCNVEKLSSASGLTTGEVERKVPRLLRSGYIRPPGTGVGSATDEI